MAKSYRWGSGDKPRSGGAGYAPWQTRIQTKLKKETDYSTFKKKAAPITITNDLARAIQFRLVPKDVIARIHVYNVAQAIAKNKGLIKNTNITGWAQRYISTATEAQLSNGMEITLRGRPVFLAEGQLEEANIHSYSGFINAAKRALKIALIEAGENAQKKFNYSELIDFVSKGQKKAFNEGLTPLLRSIALATDPKVMHPPEKMLNRDAKLLQTKEELSNLLDKISEERRATVRAIQQPELKGRIHKVTLVDYERVFHLMEQYEEFAKGDIIIGEHEKKLLSEWRELKAKMAFSEVETK